MKSVIVGMGEVGTALFRVLSGKHEVVTKDIASKRLPVNIDVLHICLRYDDRFVDTVNGYITKCNPKIVDICTTVPPGTTSLIGSNAVHSTTRGLHPNLEKSIRTFCKHIGGRMADKLADYYVEAGVKTITHKNPETTELAHILSNCLYGVNLMFADEMSNICRNYGVDYVDSVIGYNKTSNDGYAELGHESKFRMLLTPPGGSIGGHCVVSNAKLISGKGSKMVDMLAEYSK